ncbi:uncharacterized protein LOC127749570 [Frankliniella occidentalis]|uniref:Uncharacterized protein LOC127749570 n=1 Tax=Frankliniella occidentalis TaxID=133901 RepID=A0A9C6U627_FRAOC|nr:uncharacterized protein LOC127749570 [Frankliniella occidentalis]
MCRGRADQPGPPECRPGDCRADHLGPQEGRPGDCRVCCLGPPECHPGDCRTDHPGQPVCPPEVCRTYLSCNHGGASEGGGSLPPDERAGEGAQEQGERHDDV